MLKRRLAQARRSKAPAANGNGESHSAFILDFSATAANPPARIVRVQIWRYGACLKALRNSSCFVIPSLHTSARVDTLQAAGAEDKPLLGSKLSADSGAKTRLGLGESRASANLIHWD
jgi:hypothetical protein